MKRSLFPLLLLPLLLVLGVPTFATARCVTADDLTNGIAFKRQDGRTGLAITSGDMTEVDYSTNSTGAWQDLRKTDRGIYEYTWAWTPTEDYYVGGGPGEGYEYKIKGNPPEPRPGQTWKTTVRVRQSQDDGTERGGKVLTYTLRVTYQFLDLQQANLSGCAYTILPVEATFTGKTTSLTRRWIYFPDLGFGLETRLTDRTNGTDRKLGLTALKPLG